ncbi:hypothetical protein MBM_09081 [Drepanopeziza brunnea f. sp. 'multigermtubi' MB_m1]|uniref:Uncharacterized protein n=1 Tax=Marssonina brunnea f. sp. multigermtubi (strain MB_m1) TaxID=1072389 RepID=K1WKR7_MARBU|nr:uncharacterized protein MBM_09081 [Drepanopeziza brunnea f. sp. 'multigermtubi' MB_m1]EKD12852.1 hypothetical protein MBM_09081 [Drepanopeziza brunnea f. sp. 'multigermtubi' MB_m1]
MQFSLAVLAGLVAIAYAEINCSCTGALQLSVQCCPQASLWSEPPSPHHPPQMTQRAVRLITGHSTQTATSANLREPARLITRIVASPAHMAPTAETRRCRCAPPVFYAREAMIEARWRVEGGRWKVEGGRWKVEG